MITTTTKRKYKIVYNESTINDGDITTYKCSDGTKFTNENDSKKGYKKGIELANEHEEYINEIIQAKKELNFVSINDYKSEGYEKCFCFKYTHNLSELTKEVLVRLVYDIKHKESLSKMREGWFHVIQNVYEIPSNSMNCKYSCRGEVSYLEDLITEKEAELSVLKNILK